MKKRISFLLTAVLAAGSTIGVYGANFSDINNIPWAGAAIYINEVADSGIMVGSTVDGKQVFRGKEAITLCETSQIVYSLLEKTGYLKSVDGLEAKWDTVMSGYKIPDWAKKSVSYCLENGIVAPDDLKAFVADGKSVGAKREQVAYIVGRALQTVDGDLSGGGAVNFNDATKISAVAIPYVEMLNKQGILSGDPDGNFNPDITINRAEMAVVVSKSLSKINELKAADAQAKAVAENMANTGTTGNTGNTVTVPGIDPNMPVISGLGNASGIVYEVQINGENRLVVLNAATGNVGYMGAGTMPINYSDGSTGLLSDVAAGDNVTIIYESSKIVSLVNNSAKKVDEPVVEQKTKGVVQDLSSKNIRISGGDTLYVSRDTTVSLDGKTKKLDDLIEAYDDNDEIYVELEVASNGDVSHIKATIEESGSEDGEISTISDSSIKVGGTSYDLAAESDLTIDIIDGSNSIDDLDDLIDAVKSDKKKIEVTLTEKNDEVTKIKGEVVELDCSIVAVSESGDTIKIETYDGNKFTYDVSSSVDIDVDNDEDMDLGDLEDYFDDEGDFSVTLKFSGKSIKEIAD